MFKGHIIYLQVMCPFCLATVYDMKSIVYDKMTLITYSLHKIYMERVINGTGFN
ncbi:hypothetical protein LKI01_03390 [Companilactobacillus paralimentarius]|uniref:Uncharacterized protein n=1 Tax=Companilactobacillus kimchii TaxID=2801452 RepID=A0A210PD70_9LACO|nr:hypothetical protein LKACC12383_00330 [Companilactobacillus kimchii]GEO46340.1 hypothetical protein LKI01_03390 [Companilactobacillus paralimentarius]